MQNGFDGLCNLSGLRSSGLPQLSSRATFKWSCNPFTRVSRASYEAMPQGGGEDLVFAVAGNVCGDALGEELAHQICADATGEADGGIGEDEVRATICFGVIEIGESARRTCRRANRKN